MADAMLSSKGLYPAGNLVGQKKCSALEMDPEPISHSQCSLDTRPDKGI
jgi:hypothetical protein